MGNSDLFMYEGARTISLLPSVRQIQGSNRASADEDVVKERRFSEDAHTTVQQIYNNMANNVSVSEVYGILEGLDYKKGQVLFFMYDSVIFQNGDNSDSVEKAKTADTPEESEEAEYEYYPKQIDVLKKDEKQRLNDEKIQEKRKVISDFSQAIKQVASGNLGVKIQANTGDELGALALNFDELMKSLNSIISKVKDNSGLIAESSQQLDISMDDITAKSEGLTNNAIKISGEVEKLADTVEQIYENSRLASEEATSTKEYADEGSVSINNTLQSMRNIKNIVKDSFDAVRDLDEKSKEIGNIKDTVNIFTLYKD